jgi:hypothetical protein
LHFLTPWRCASWRPRNLAPQLLKRDLAANILTLAAKAAFIHALCGTAEQGAEKVLAG